jgi:hypothetical protein
MDNLCFFNVNSASLEGFKEITTRIKEEVNLTNKKNK